MNEKDKRKEYTPPERLFQDIGGISADIIEEALQTSLPERSGNHLSIKSMRKWIYSVGAIAACLIIFIGTGLLLDMKKPEVIQIDSRWNTSEGAVGSPDWAKSAEELYRDVPYDENIILDSMPVFKRSYYIDRDTLQYVSFDIDVMKKLLLQHMRMLGADVENTSVVTENYYGEAVENIEDGDSLGRIYAETDDFLVNVYPDLTVLVYLTNPVSLPPEYDVSAYASYEDKRKSAEYIIENYGSWLGFENPKINLERGDYDMDGKQTYSITFYEGKPDYKENLISSNRGKVIIYSDEDGRIDSIRYCPESGVENMGDYPIISPKEAVKLAEDEGASNIQKIFIGYNREMPGDEYMLPCYFVVSEYHSSDSQEYFPGQKEFITYCIPAVTAAYLKRVE